MGVSCMIGGLENSHNSTISTTNEMCHMQWAYWRSACCVQYRFWRGLIGLAWLLERFPHGVEVVGALAQPAGGIPSPAQPSLLQVHVLVNRWASGCGWASAAWPRLAERLCSQKASCSDQASVASLLQPAAGGRASASVGCTTRWQSRHPTILPQRQAQQPTPSHTGLCACLSRQQLVSVLGKDTAQQVFNPPAATPSRTAATPAASPPAPAAGDAELDELHSQADEAIPSTQSAEQLGGSSGRKRKFTLQANPSLAGMAKGVSVLRPIAWGSICRTAWGSTCRPTLAWQADKCGSLARDAACTDRQQHLPNKTECQA